MNIKLTPEEILKLTIHPSLDTKGYSVSSYALTVAEAQVNKIRKEIENMELPENPYWDCDINAPAWEKGYKKAISAILELIGE